MLEPPFDGVPAASALIGAIQSAVSAQADLEEVLDNYQAGAQDDKVRQSQLVAM